MLQARGASLSVLVGGGGRGVSRYKLVQWVKAHAAMAVCGVLSGTEVAAEEDIYLTWKLTAKGTKQLQAIIIMHVQVNREYHD